MDREIVNEETHNYNRILNRISSVATKCGRDPNEIRLIVVTKGQPIEKILSVVKAGAKELGENYLEEAIPKMEKFRQHNELVWHMIGHIQSRKAAGVSQSFDYVQALDSVKLARRMSRELEALNTKMPVLIEFNVSGEESKFGFSAWEEAGWHELVPELLEIVKQPRLTICGLMGMAPFGQNPEISRPYFQKLFRLKVYLESQFPDQDWREISMGMSTDFEIAIQEGATIVRIGEAIMGKRN